MEELIPVLAGFFSGEGTVFIQRTAIRRKTADYRVIIAVGQNHRDPLDKLQAAFGGAVNLDLTRSRPFWRWKVGGNPATKALLVMRPWLLTKHNAADLAVDFQVEFNATNMRGKQMRQEVLALREAYRQAIKEANRE